MKKDKIKKRVIFFIFILIEELIYYIYYRFCLKCINIIIIDNNNKRKCIECPIELIFKGLKIVSNEKTLDEIIYKNKSISRYGDGEYRIIFGENIVFQKADQQLRNKLLEILNIKDKGFLVGINLPYQNKILKQLKKNSQMYWIKYLNKYKFKIAKIIKNRIILSI